MGGAGQIDYGDVIDQATFEQILEMDDEEEDREFSRSIVFGFFEQAENTLKEMHRVLEDTSNRESLNLEELSRLGHFLKGSSATLGLTKVKDSFERIQNYGSRKNDQGNLEPDVTNDSWLRKIRETVLQVEQEYADVEQRLKAFYGVSGNE